MNNVKNINEFVAKTALNIAIKWVLVTKDAIVATDSFKLIERKTETGIETPVCVHLPRGLKTFDGVVVDGEKVRLTHKGEWYDVQTTNANQFPKWEMILPKKKPVLEIRLSIKHLVTIMNAMNTMNDNNNVAISFYGEHEVVIFKGEDTRALLMPIHK